MAAYAAVDAAVEEVLCSWLDAALALFLPQLAAPTQRTTDELRAAGESEAAPVDLVDDDDEMLEHACLTLSACVRCRSARLADRAAAVALPLLCADGLKVHEADAGKAALTLAGELFGARSAAAERLLVHDGYGAALTLALLNGAGGALPSFVHDAVGTALRALYTARPDAAATWVHGAAASAQFSHPRVTGPAASAVEPTGGAASLRTNYATVLGYLAQHGAWDHFQTVLTRGVAVSGAEEQEA